MRAGLRVATQPGDEGKVQVELVHQPVLGKRDFKPSDYKRGPFGALVRNFRDFNFEFPRMVQPATTLQLLV